MLTQNQIGYLTTIPEGKTASIHAFDPASQIAAQKIISEIHNALPTAEIYYIGSSKLGIAGENDIDMTVISGDQFNSFLGTLTKIYGTPVQSKPEKQYIKWEFTEDGFMVELHLTGNITPEFQEQLDTQHILEHNEKLRIEYEQLKLRCDGIPWKEYLTQKYEFWNRILEL